MLAIRQLAITAVFFMILAVVAKDATAQITTLAGAPVTLVVTSPPPGQEAPVFRGFYEDSTASQEAAGWLATLLRQKGWDARVVYYAGPEEAAGVSLRWHIQAFSHPVQTGGYDLPLDGRSVSVQEGRAASLVLIDRVSPQGQTRFQGYGTASSREVQTYSGGGGFLGQIGDVLLGNALSNGNPETAEAKAARNAFAKALGQIGELPTAHTTTAAPAATTTFQPGNMLTGEVIIGPDGPITNNYSAAPAATTPTPAARYPIRRSSANQGDIVAMGISGLSVGQELPVLRDGNYIGRARVIEILANNQARCRVIDANTYDLGDRGDYIVR